MYKIILIVLQYSTFSHFEILGGRGIQGLRKRQVGNSTQTFIFDIFKTIGIRNSPHIFLIYWMVQNSANLCFFLTSVWYFWFVTGKFISSYVSKFNISAADTESMNNHEIITLASFLELYICYLSRFLDCLM